MGSVPSNVRRKDEPIRVNLGSNGAYWQAWWWEDGKRMRRGMGRKKTATKKAATEACRKLESELNDPDKQALKASGGSPSLSRWIKRFLRTNSELSEQTLNLYEQTGAHLTEYFGNEEKLANIAPADAVDWKAWLATLPGAVGGTMAESTVRKHVRIARRLYASAVEQGFAVGRNPFLAVKAAPLKLEGRYGYLSTEDLEEILDACPDAGWKAFWGLMRLAGLRRDEARALEWSDVDMELRTATVRPRSGKQTTKQRLRKTPIQERLYDLLLECREERPKDEPLVCWGLTPHDTQLHRQGKRIVEDAGLEPWPVLYHSLRQNLINEWQREHPPLDASRWLGHSIVVASQSYGEERQSAMDRVSGRAV